MIWGENRKENLQIIFMKRPSNHKTRHSTIIRVEFAKVHMPHNKPLKFWHKVSFFLTANTFLNLIMLRGTDPNWNTERSQKYSLYWRNLANWKKAPLIFDCTLKIITSKSKFNAAQSSLLVKHLWKYLGDYLSQKIF